MQPSSIAHVSAAACGADRSPGSGHACGVVTVLLIAASMQLLRDRARRAVGRAARRAPRRHAVTVDVAAADRAARHRPRGPVRDDGPGRARSLRPSPGSEVVLERAVRGGGWQVVGRERPRTAAGSATFSPCAGARYRVAHRRRAGCTWSSRPRATTARWTPDFEDTFSGSRLDTSVWNDQKREHESGLRAAHLRPRRPGCATASATASSTSAWRWTRRAPASRATTTGRRGAPGTQPLPAHQPGRHRAHLLLPARHRRRAHQAAARQGHALGVLDAPQRQRRTTDDDPARGAEIDVMEFFGETRAAARRPSARS